LHIRKNKIPRQRQSHIVLQEQRGVAGILFSIFSALKDFIKQ